MPLYRLFNDDSVSHLNMAVITTGTGESGVLHLINVLKSYWYLLVPVVLVLRFFYYRYASPLRNYPGPFLASGSRAWKGEMDNLNLHGTLLMSV